MHFHTEMVPLNNDWIKKYKNYEEWNIINLSNEILEFHYVA
jgi:hypothetical protein